MLWKIIEQVKEGEGVTVFKKMVRVGLNEKETSGQGLDGVGKPAVFLGEGAVKYQGWACAGKSALCWAAGRPEAGEAQRRKEDETRLGEEIRPHGVEAFVRRWLFCD